MFPVSFVTAIKLQNPFEKLFKRKYQKKKTLIEKSDFLINMDKRKLFSTETNK